MSELASSLRATGFRGRLEPECPLAPHTSWRIGGPAELLATPRDREDLLLAMEWIRRTGSPWRILGNGSNLLVRDQGVRGLVLHLRKVLDGSCRHGEIVEAGAGVLFPAIARQSALAGLAGIEFGAGIPGTLGGALVMNAGWHEHEIGNAVDVVEVLEPDGTVRDLGREACEFRYRRSRFRGGSAVVLGARLRLEPGDPSEIQARLAGFAASRKAHQPTEVPSCGSVFLKPDGDFAGRLIDQAGLKGLRIGDVQVSFKHANFFVNLGQASAADVLLLVERVEREVEARFGVRLVREFELW